MDVEDFAMAGLWLGGLRSMAEAPAPKSQAQPDAMPHIRELHHQIERLTLLNQALWELLRTKISLTDQELEQKIHEIDVRDGIEDGRMTKTALKCPTCGRVSSSKHWKCLYCGQEFEKPVMG
jgi:hypothetical protein